MYNYNLRILLLLVILIISGCNDNNSIRQYRISKQHSTEEVKTANTKPLGLHWTAHSDWIPGKMSSFRIGSFIVPFSMGEGDLSIIKLDGKAGGLLANINRWRKQLNLEPQNEEEINDYLNNDISPLGEFQWLKIINPKNIESSFLIAIFETNTYTIFVKLNVPIAGIVELESTFISFCKSFSLSTHEINN